MIRDLLAEAGRTVRARETSGPRGRALDDRDHPRDLPRRRPRRTLHQRDALAGLARLHRAERPCPPNEFAYRGKWRITLDSATAEAGASLDLNFGARRVYLVLGSPGRDRRVRVLLDGKPISAADAGADVHGGAVTVTGQRLYNLVDLPKVGHHVLTLEPEAGVEGYAFTFG